MKFARGWVRTSNPVIRSPSRYLWTTTPPIKNLKPITFLYVTNNALITMFAQKADISALYWAPFYSLASDILKRGFENLTGLVETLEINFSKDWDLVVLHRNILETGVLTRVVQNSSPKRRSRVGDEFWTTSVRTPVSKMLSWRTAFSPTTLLWDIGNLTAWSGIFPRPYGLKACLDFHIAMMSIYINVIKSDVTHKFTK